MKPSLLSAQRASASPRLPSVSRLIHRIGYVVAKSEYSMILLNEMVEVLAIVQKSDAATWLAEMGEVE